MSNDSPPVGSAHGFDSDALEQWVAETASQKGVSKQQLLDEILSSYWILEELSGVVSNDEVTADARQSDGQPSVETPNRPQEPAADPTDTTYSDLSTANEFTELKSELQGLRTAIEELSADQQSEEADSTDQATEADFSALEGQIDDLSSAVVDRQTETDETVAQLGDQLETVDSRLGELESQLEGVSPSEIENRVATNTTAQSELEDRIESEFDSIEQVLQHLLDTTDNIEYRLGAVSDSRQEALRPLRERNAMQDELAEIKQEALRHEVKQCECDGCGQSIDLGLLERPHCPSCERHFTGISKGGWFPFSKPKLKTAERTADSTPQSRDRSNPGVGPNSDRASSSQSGSQQYQTDW